MISLKVRRIALGIAVAVFWALISMTFESVAGQGVWHNLPWWFCDALTPFGAIASFIAFYPSE